MMARRYISAVRSAELVRRTGTVSQFFGLIVEANGPDGFVGEVCEIYSRGSSTPTLAEIVGLKDGKVLLMPYGELRGISLGSSVIATGCALHVGVSRGLLGRTIDAFGQPLDGLGAPEFTHRQPLDAEPMNPFARGRIVDQLETGVRGIDAFLTLGRGQRVGIFAGSGVGKSTLLGMIARNDKASVNVIALIGERGREVREFIDKALGPDGLRRSVVVVATSEQPALVRSRAAYTATAIAEFFRNQGEDVLLIMDSVTRFAMAQREIGLAVGEPPTARGYTPSVFATLPKLVERCGKTEAGPSITAIYTVLVEGDDLNDPIADALRATLDGHIVLSREIAHRGRYPSLDILSSTSRLFMDIVAEPERKLVRRATQLLSTYNTSRDMVEIGAYRAGSNSDLDMAIKVMPELEKFLHQDVNEHCGRADAMRQLNAIVGGDRA